MRFGLLLMVLSLAACSDDGMTRALSAFPAMPRRAPWRRRRCLCRHRPVLRSGPLARGRQRPRPTSQEQQQEAGSVGQDALLQAAGPAATADVRQLIDENSGMSEPGAEFTDRLMNWTPQPGSKSMSEPAKKGWLSRIL